jgi:hypothetical protein
MRLAGLAAPLLVIVLGCRGQPPAATGLYVTVDLGAFTVDQLELSVADTATGATVVPPTLRPAAAGAPLASPQSVTIYLTDALAGTTVACAAAGLSGGARLPVGATGTATLSRGELVALALALGDTSAADAGADGDMGAADAGADGKPNGGACGAPGDCGSGVCVDGICCDSACGDPCVSCRVAGKEGTCSPVAAGTASAGCADQGVASCGYDGKCDGNGGCRRYTAGSACTPATCQGSVLTPTAACDGQGTCSGAPTVDCAPFLCDASGGVPAHCRTTCSGDGDCVTGKSCVNGSCGVRPKQQDGAGCLAGSDCLSTVCQDGVCCEKACAGSCMSCSVPGSEGKCVAVPAGKVDPHGVCKDMGVAGCKTDGLCDGMGGCALYPSGAVCKAPVCGGRGLQLRRCDGLGTCRDATVDCTPFRCNPLTSACFDSCTSTILQCTTGATCDADGGVCR